MQQSITPEYSITLRGISEYPIDKIIYTHANKDASYRLDISNLKRQINDWKQKYTIAIQQINELKRIQQRDNTYILRLDNYIIQVKDKLNKQQQTINKLNAQIKSQSLQPQIVHKPIMVSINTEPSYNETLSTSQLLALKTDSSLQMSDSKYSQPQKKPIDTINTKFKCRIPLTETYAHNSTLHEKFLNKMLDDDDLSSYCNNTYQSCQEKIFTSNSQQSNFSFANSERKRRCEPTKNRQSMSTEDKENNYRFHN